MQHFSNFDDVGAFHQKFGLPNSNEGIERRPLDYETYEFRRDFLLEEVREFIEAFETDDQAGMADALIDLVYVAMGTAHLMGLPWQVLWNEVQRANMTKQRASEDGSDSKRGNSLDVVKPPGWTPPDIEGILERHWREPSTEERGPAKEDTTA